MAPRKPKDTPEQEPEQAKSSEVRRAISAKKLKSLLSSCRSAQQNINEISGGLGEEIKAAIEKNHLHRKAFNVVKMADRMEPEKLSEFMDHLDHYFEISGLNARAEQVERLAMGDVTQNGEGDPDEDDEGNVRPFPGRQAAE